MEHAQGEQAGRAVAGARRNLASSDTAAATTTRRPRPTGPTSGDGCAETWASRNHPPAPLQPPASETWRSWPRGRSRRGPSPARQSHPPRSPPFCSSGGGQRRAGGRLSGGHSNLAAQPGTAPAPRPTTATATCLELGRKKTAERAPEGMGRPNILQSCKGAGRARASGVRPPSTSGCSTAAGTRGDKGGAGEQSLAGLYEPLPPFITRPRHPRHPTPTPHTQWRRTHPPVGEQARRLCEPLLREALGAVPGDHGGALVGQHRGQLVLGAHQAQQACVCE